jgi:asparagine synthetase B (glutamine-hydrolysing)
MCGFGVTNINDIRESNSFCKRRGPDLTNVKTINGIQFLHNLLHITGDFTPQPLEKDGIVLVFNGEIYNYKSFGDYTSDAEAIIDAYKSLDNYFARKLDGEFAFCLIDFNNDKIIISTDTFACKPLWYEIKGNTFCFASYNSQLQGLGFDNGVKLKSNTTKIFRLRDLQELHQYANTEFDIEQYKNTYDDWLTAWSNSIKKRTQNTQQGMFIGLSSGYDSGAIACELTKQNIDFTAYSIQNNENESILKQRFNLLKNVDAFHLTENDFSNTRQELKKQCEDFVYQDQFFNYDIKKDQASVGLASICKRANARKQKIYFSGQGADEIISDYGFDGKKIYKHSSFGGLFPDVLRGWFPWHSFWDGTQIQYLNKEEYVAGHFGIETRYPFLDRDLVQEFLWLKPELKNSKYKSVLDEYLTRNSFPFQPAEKRGFHVTKKGKN